MEEQLFIKSGSAELFSMLFTPENDICKSIGYVIVHPFADEKKNAHRTLVELARSLSGEGYPVLMFDLNGTGDSFGEFGKVCLETWLEDMNNSINYLRERTRLVNIGIIGLRLGAFLSLEYTEKYDYLEYYIFIEPIVKPINYLRKVLRKKLIKELCTDRIVISNRDLLMQELKRNSSIDFDGFEINGDLYNDLVKSQFISEIQSNIRDIESRLLLISVSAKRRSRDIDYIMSLIQDNSKLYTINIEPFWERIYEVNNKILIDTIIKNINKY